MRDCTEAHTMLTIVRISELSLLLPVLATPGAHCGGPRRSEHHVCRYRAHREIDRRASRQPLEEALMNGIIYLIGLIVVIMFILSLLGLR
jgi:hypothetical protein